MDRFGSVGRCRSARAFGAVLVFVVAVGSLVAAPFVSAPAAATSGNAYEDAVAADGPVSYWRMEDSSDSGSAGNMLPTSPVQVPGPFALAGNATSSNFRVGVQPELSTPDFSVEAWFKIAPGQGGDNRYIFRTRTYGQGILVRANGKLLAYVAAGGSGTGQNLESVLSYDDDQWHQVVHAKSGTTLRMFVDGVQVATRAVSAAVRFGHMYVGVGRDGDASAVFRGQLDEVAYYGYGLSGSQVASHYLASGVRMSFFKRMLLGALVKSGMVGDPVNAYLGNFLDERVDLPFDGVFGVSLGSTYNSADETASMFGRGWSSSVSARLVRDEGSVGFVAADGRELWFNPVPGSSPQQWRRPNELQADLVYDSVGDRFGLQYWTGERLDFDTDGRLIAHCEGRSDWQTAGPDWCVDPLSSGYVGDSISLAWSGAASVVVTSNRGPWVELTDANSDGRVDQAVSSDGRIVDYTYDGGALETVSDPHTSSESSWAETLYVVDPVSSLVIEKRIRTAGDTGGGRLLVANTYDADGRVVEQINEDGDLLTFFYDDVTSTTTVTNAASGDQIVYVHDLSGRLVEVTDDYAKSASKSWNDDAQLQEFGDRLGAAFGYTFDGEGRLIQRVSPDPTTGALPARTGGAGSPFPAPGGSDGWSVESYSYVGLGDPRVLEHVNGEGEVTRFGYDGAELTPSSVTVGYGTADAITTSYEVVDERVQWSEDADGIRTCLSYDGAGRVEEQSVGCTSGSPLVTSFGYDGAGRLSWRRDPAQQPSGPTWSYEYTGAGRLVKETKPDATFVTYGYEPVTGGLDHGRRVGQRDGDHRRPRCHGRLRGGRGAVSGRDHDRAG